MQTTLLDAFASPKPAPLPLVLSFATMKAPPEDPAAVPTDLQQAVASTSDTTDINPLAQTMSDIDGLVKQINNASDQQDMEAALAAVKDFLSSHSHADMISDTLQELSQMASAVQEAIAKDPNALGEHFHFSVNADFGQQATYGQNYYKNVTSFSLSYRFESDNTLMTGTLSADESIEQSDAGMRYQSNQSVAVNMVTMNVNLDTNPVLKTMTNLIRGLIGVDVTDTLSQAANPPVNDKPASDFAVAQPYSIVSFLDQLKAQLEQLNKSLDQNQQLLVLLQPDEDTKNAFMQLPDYPYAAVNQPLFHSQFETAA